MMNTHVLSSLTILAIPILVSTALSIAPSPAQGIQLGYPELGWDIRFPLSVSQCEPVHIYYNYTRPQFGDTVFISVQRPEESPTLLTIEATNEHSKGYIEWICDIPTGYSFIAGLWRTQQYVVQPGSSSSCLGDITRNYPYASYNTIALHSYTQDLPYTVSLCPYNVVTQSAVIPLLARSPSATAASPPASDTQFPTPSPPWPDMSSSMPIHHVRTPIVVGVLLGAFSIILSVFVAVIVYLRRSNRPNPLEVPHPFTPTPEKNISSPTNARGSSAIPPLILVAPSFPGPSARTLPRLTTDQARIFLPEGINNASDAQWSPMTPYPLTLSGTLSRVPVEIRVVSPRDHVNLSMMPTSEVRTPRSNRPRISILDILSPVHRDSGRARASISPLGGGMSPHDAVTSNSTIALNSVARLNPEERATFIAMLRHMTTPVRPRSANDNDSVISAPPPYACF